MSIHDNSGERLEQLLGVYRTDPGVDFEAAAADEIERLRAELADATNRVGCLEVQNARQREIICDPAKSDVRLLRERIEELMNHLKRAIAPVEVGGGADELHIITNEQLASCEVVMLTRGQIDKAWADAWEKYKGTDSTAGFSSLEKVGIVACEGCGGSGGIPEGGNVRTCPSCHGHGWVIK